MDGVGVGVGVEVRVDIDEGGIRETNEEDSGQDALRASSLEQIPRRKRQPPHPDMFTT